MNKKIHLLSLIITGMGLFTACEKSLEDYSGKDYIYFSLNSGKDSVLYNFGLAGKEDTDRLGLEIRAAGNVTDYARTYTVKVSDKSSAHHSVHYTIDNKNCIFRANRVVDTLWIDLKNSPELKNGKVFLQLDLEENADFKLCFPQQNSSRIYLTDLITRPDWWDVWHETEGLGSYSEKKYRLFIKVTGVSDLSESTVQYPERREAMLKFKYYLLDEALKGNPIPDEDGQPMKVEIYG